MYNYAASTSLFEGVSNIYVLSTATVFLAVIIALYCANFLKGIEETSNAIDDAGIIENIDEDDVETEAKDTDMNSETKRSPFLNCSQKPFMEDDDEDFDNINSETLNDGLVSKLKSARLRKLEAQLTQQQLDEERRVEREQLSAIFELLKRQETEFNMKEIDESELAAQLHLYR